MVPSEVGHQDPGALCIPTFQDQGLTYGVRNSITLSGGTGGAPSSTSEQPWHLLGPYLLCCSMRAALIPAGQSARWMKSCGLGKLGLLQHVCMYHPAFDL